MEISSTHLGRTEWDAERSIIDRPIPAIATVRTGLPARLARPPHVEAGRQNPYTVLAICGLLLLAIGLVFGQTVRHDFVNYDDPTYVYEKRANHARPNRPRDRLGLHHRPWQSTGTR